MVSKTFKFALSLFLSHHGKGYPPLLIPLPPGERINSQENMPKSINIFLILK